MLSSQTKLTLRLGHVCPVYAQVGSLRMVFSLEELGPALQQTPHQGPVDTATAAAAAAAQPTASLGAAALPDRSSSAGGQQAAAHPVSAAQQATGSTMPGSLTVSLVCIVAVTLCGCHCCAMTVSWVVTPEQQTIASIAALSKFVKTKLSMTKL